MKLKNLWLIAVAILIYACNAEETRSWEVTFDPNKPKDPNEQSIINVAAGKFYKMNVVANSAYADKAPLDPWTSGTKLTMRRPVPSRLKTEESVGMHKL